MLVGLLLVGVGLLLVFDQALCNKLCTSNTDCAAEECCQDPRQLFSILQRGVAPRTCGAKGGVGASCPAYSEFHGTCGCRSDLVCYVAPSGVAPRYGHCITRAQHQIELEKIKNNPWLLMIP